MKSKKIIILRSVLLTLIFLWCALIFFMSAETADISSNRSEGLSEKIIGFFLSVFNLEGEQRLELVETFETFLRKGAHMFSYFVLSVLSLSFAFTFDRIKTYARVLSSLAFSLVYALSDEIHQLYVEGRSGSFRDVLIDMTGAFLGALAVLAVCYIKTRKKKKGSQQIT